MMTRQKRIFVLTFLALFTLVFSYSITMAQTPTIASQVEIIGVVDAMDTNTITVNQQVIDITKAEVKLTLAVGTAVKVEGSVNPDGTISAREVTAPDAVAGGMLPGEVEISGLLTALNSTTMTIAGQTFDVSTAEIKAGVVVGQIVKVHATLSNTGVWVAREVELATQTDNNGADDNGVNDNPNDDNTIVNFSQGESELTGTLTAMSATSITVAGQIIDTTNAEIKGTLVVGALVKVHIQTVNGQAVAREIELSGQNGKGNNNTVVLPPNCVAAQPTGWVTYTVQAGDTLSDIADRSNGSLSIIAIANCISDTRNIVVGTTIFVPEQPTSIGSGGDDHGGDSLNNGNDDSNHIEDNHNGNDDPNGDNHGGDNGNNGNGNQGDNGSDNGGHGGQGSGDGSGHG